MKCECCKDCYKIDACDGRCNFKCDGCTYNKTETSHQYVFAYNWKDVTNIININYGDNTMSFDKNGDIKINNRLLENDKEIVDALRILLNLK